MTDDYHTTSAKHIVNFQDLNRILRLEIFLHTDGQLRAAHVILGYKPSTKHFQSPKNIIRAKDLRPVKINVAVPRFLLTEPPLEGTQDAQLLAPLAARPTPLLLGTPHFFWRRGKRDYSWAPSSRGDRKRLRSLLLCRHSWYFCNSFFERYGFPREKAGSPRSAKSPCWGFFPNCSSTTLTPHPRHDTHLTCRGCGQEEEKRSGRKNSYRNRRRRDPRALC